MSDSIPISSLFTRYRRYLPGLVGAGAGAVASALLGGYSADKAISRDSNRPVTWVPYKRPVPTMKRPRPMLRRRAMRRMTRRISRFRRPVSDGYTIVRRTAINGAGFAVSGTLNPSVQGMSFLLSYLPNVTDFTNLYQQYRIKKIQIKLIPRNDFGNSNGLGVAAVGTSIPQIALANDTAKTFAPTDLNTVLSYNNCRLLDMHGSRPVYHTLFPKSINTVQGVNVNPSYDWLFTSNTTIPHYGVQFAWVTATPNIAIDVYATYTVEFKGRA